MAGRTVPIDVGGSHALARQIVAQLPRDTTAVAAEMAFLFAYCLVAGGCRAFPRHTAFARILEIVARGSRSMVEHIEAVGRLSDDEIVALTTTPEPPRG